MKKLTALLVGGLTLVSLTACSSGGSSEGGGTYDGDVTACTVTDKQAIGRTDSDGTSSTDYRIFSSCGVFGVQDDWFIGQWNSADTYGSIEVGKTYDFEAYGWRNGFTSTFPNIKTAKEVSGGAVQE